MELDDFKSAWQSLDQRLALHNRLNLELLREGKLQKARSSLRPLLWGQILQMLLGLALIALGVACWSHNLHTPGLLATGILLHAFGVVTTAMAGLTIALLGTIDYSAPVLAIQKRMGRLLRFYLLNSVICGWSWWIMWVPVVVGFAGLGGGDRAATTPAWIWISLGIGVCGLLATWVYAAWAQGRRATAVPTAQLHDGADGIRRSSRLLDEIARFEQE